MPNPLSQISSLLALLGKEIKILPATGDAVEGVLTDINSGHKNVKSMS